MEVSTAEHGSQDWRKERAAALGGARTVVVKVGSAVLTRQDEVGRTLDFVVIADLAAQLSALNRKGVRVVLVSSGAVAAGRTALANMSKAVPGEDLAGKQAAAAVGQGRLMRYYEEAFACYRVVTAQVLLTREDLKSRQRFLNARNTFANLLDWGVIPIVNENDTVAVDELKFSDNDNLASLLLNVVEADIFVNLTSTGGVLDKNPLHHADAAIMPCIDGVRDLDLDSLCGGKTDVGSGGMYAKLVAARRAAQLGVPTLILPGKARGVLSAAFAGEDVGTWVRPGTHSISRRKFWLAYRAEPAGTLHVDAGAAEAVMTRGSSLLPGGVVSVEGCFGCGDPVQIMAGERVIGVGLSNYDAETLARIKGLKRHEVAAILGMAHYPEVIHRDNLLVDAIV